MSSKIRLIAVVAISLAGLSPLQAHAVLFSTADVAYGGEGTDLRDQYQQASQKNNVYFSASDSDTNSNAVASWEYGVTGIFNNFLDLNAISTGSDTKIGKSSFVSNRAVLFLSVSAASVGGNNTAVNVQSNANSVSADVFSYGGVAGQNALMQNELDIGVDDGSAAPSGSADEVDALEIYSGAYNTHTDYAGASDEVMYFSFSGEGDIYMSGLDGSTFTTYMTGTSDIGLLANDDIDALVLNTEEEWALFSLSSTSGSVLTHGLSGADVFLTTFDGSYSLFLEAEELGLLETDEIDGLESVIPVPPVLALMLPWLPGSGRGRGRGRALAS